MPATVPPEHAAEAARAFVRRTCDELQDLLFFLGIFAPDLRASLSAIATACLRLFTFLPLPDFSGPSLCSCMTLRTVERPTVFLAGMYLFSHCLAKQSICRERRLQGHKSDPKRYARARGAL